MGKENNGWFHFLAFVCRYDKGWYIFVEGYSHWVNHVDIWVKDRHQINN